LHNGTCTDVAQRATPSTAQTKEAQGATPRAAATAEKQMEKGAATKAKATTKATADSGSRCAKGFIRMLTIGIRKKLLLLI